jgi:hypothetical protein
LNFFVTLMNSQSRGEVTLASADPADKPIINPRYLDNAYDGLVLKNAMREALHWVESPSLKKFIKKPILAPESADDEQLKVCTHTLLLFSPRSPWFQSMLTDGRLSELHYRRYHVSQSCELHGAHGRGKRPGGLRGCRPQGSWLRRASSRGSERATRAPQWT